jgi:hypothetical protein
MIGRQVKVIVGNRSTRPLRCDADHPSTMTSPLSSSRPPIVVSAARVRRDAERAVVSADIHADDLSMPSSIWFDVSSRFGDALAVNGDPFLPPVLMRAMREGRQMIVEDSVSAQLAASAHRVMDVHAAWSRDAAAPLRSIPFIVSPQPRAERGWAAACLFSGGVDAFYTLLKNQARYPRTDSRAISHLIVVHGLDVPLDNPELFSKVEASTQAVAHALGLHLVTVRTNVRQVVSGVDWGLHSHGATLASLALALSRLFHTVFIASGSSYFELHPWGSHPAIDPLWSTESLEIVHDGAEADRAYKLEYLTQSPLALAHLRVCWKNPGGAYNCGRCEKCLRTMAALEVAGVLDRAATFPSRIAAADVRALAIRPNQANFWQPSLQRFRRSAHHRELVAAIEDAIERGRGAGAAPGSFQTMIRGYRQRVRAITARIKTADQRLLGGALATFRRALLRGGAPRRSA